MAVSRIILSGKGGVGKSFVTAGLGIALCKRGRKVCIVDTDIGLRDQDVLLGLENRIVYDLLDVAKKDCALTDALISPEEFPSLSLLPAAQFARVRELEPKAFRKIMEQLNSLFDEILIDCPAGIERGVRNILKSGTEEAIVVCTPDDVCIRNAERACQLLREKPEREISLVVNRLQSDLIRIGEMYSAETVAQVLDLPLLGEIPEDPMVYRAQLKHLSPVLVRCEAREALCRIAGRLDREKIPFPRYGMEKIPLLRRLFGRKMEEVVPL